MYRKTLLKSQAADKDNTMFLFYLSQILALKNDFQDYARFYKIIVIFSSVITVGIAISTAEDMLTTAGVMTILNLCLVFRSLAPSCL